MSRSSCRRAEAVRSPRAISPPRSARPRGFSRARRRSRRTPAARHRRRRCGSDPTGRAAPSGRPPLRRAPWPRPNAASPRPGRRKGRLAGSRRRPRRSDRPRRRHRRIRRAPRRRTGPAPIRRYRVPHASSRTACRTRRRRRTRAHHRPSGTAGEGSGERDSTKPRVARGLRRDRGRRRFRVGLSGKRIDDRVDKRADSPIRRVLAAPVNRREERPGPLPLLDRDLEHRRAVGGGDPREVAVPQVQPRRVGRVHLDEGRRPVRGEPRRLPGARHGVPLIPHAAGVEREGEAVAGARPVSPAQPGRRSGPFDRG